MAMHDGEWKPLFDLEMMGAFSPSSSLRVERHNIQPVYWPRVSIPKQIVTLALNTHEVQCRCSSGTVQDVTRTEGTVTVERREDEHSIRWKSSATTLAIELDDAVLENAKCAEAALGMENHRLQSLAPLLYALEAERQQDYPHGPIFIDGVEQAIACVVVGLIDPASTRKQSRGLSMAPYQMRRVNDYVLAHLDKKINLRDMAREAGLSISHFSRIFRKSSGITPHQYVLEQRIDHAKVLMMDSRQSLLDIAIASGFRTHQHFSKVFHRLTGHSPRQYRSQI